MKWFDKWQRILIILLLVFLPTQLGLHFWPAWAFPNGLRIDYFAPTVYLTDFVVFLILIIESVRITYNVLRIKGEQRDSGRAPASRSGQGGLLTRIRTLHFMQEPCGPRLRLRAWTTGKYLLIYCVTGLLIYFNTTHSSLPQVSLYKWLKILEYGLLFLVFFRQKQPQFPQIYLIFPVIYESILAIWQFWRQSSIGGLWYWLGERTFNSGTPGIAQVYINSHLIMRPYGTFPHPNVLGGFLAVVLPLILFFLLRSKIQSKFILSGYWFTLLLGYLVMILTFSRSAILVGILATCLILVQFFRTTTQKVLLALLAVLAIFALWLPLTHLGTEEESFNVRGQLNNLAIKQFLSHPIIGTGLGTSPLYSLYNVSSIKYNGNTNYALVGQPTHNIYLMILAESGLIGFIVLVLIIIAAVKKALHSPFYFLISLSSILALGLFDHYFITLQQGQLLFVVILVWIWGLEKEKNTGKMKK